MVIFHDFFCRLLTFFKINFSKYSFRITIRVQTVCKDQQQTTKFELIIIEASDPPLADLKFILFENTVDPDLMNPSDQDPNWFPL